MKEVYIVYSYEVYEDERTDFRIADTAFDSIEEAKHYVERLIHERSRWDQGLGNEEGNLTFLYLDDREYRIKRFVI